MKILLQNSLIFFFRHSSLKVDPTGYFKRTERIKKGFVRSLVIKTKQDLVPSTLTRSKSPPSRAEQSSIFQRLFVSIEKCFFTQPRSSSLPRLASSASLSSSECASTKLFSPKTPTRPELQPLSQLSLLRPHQLPPLFWVNTRNLTSTSKVLVSC